MTKYVPAVRFQDLSKSFNVASTSFSSITDTAIMNAPEGKLFEITDAAKGMLDQLREVNQALNDKGAEVQDLIKDATRLTKNVYDSFMDLSKLPEAKIGELINDIIPGDVKGVTNALKGMTKVCRNNALGAGLPFGKLQGAKCDGMNIGVNSCSSGAGDVLGKSLASGFNSLLDSVGNLVGKIMSLANLGFNANLCKILGGLLEGVKSKSVIGSTLGMLANQQGLKGNFTAILDIGANAIGSGVNIGKLIPGTIGNIVSGVTSFGDNYQNGTAAAYERFDAALEGIDGERFTDSLGTETPSVEKFENASLKYKWSVRNSLQGNDFDDEDMNGIPDVDENKAAIAMSTMA